MMIEQTLPKALLRHAHVQDTCQDKLLRLANVVGVALGHKLRERRGTVSDEPVITVLVSEKLERSLLAERDRVPSKIDGVRTDVVAVGDIFAGGGPLECADATPIEAGAQALRRRVRPAMGGYSVGHYQITAGTIATCCYDASAFPGIPDRYYLLSNNHVLANSNDARIGDPILQPGPFDGGHARHDVIARLSRFVPIRFDGTCNHVDAAIAEGDFEDLNRAVYWIGHVRRRYVEPKVGDVVQKTGRTTHFTTGRVVAVNATVDVNFGGGRVARFCRQIVTSGMSAPGDSGSLVTNLDEEAVGLLFAGSSTVTILNHINYVEALLNIRITEH